MTSYAQHYRSTLKLGVPLCIGQIGVILVGFADTLMVGHYGTNDLASVSFVNNLFNLVIIGLLGFSYGITPIIGALFARQKYDEAGAAFRNALIANALFGILLTVVMGCAYFFIDRFGQPDELLPIIRPYYLVILASIVFVALFNAMRQFADSLLRPSVGMWILISGNAVNIVFNYLLIYGKLGFPMLGVRGAAIATVLSRYVEFGLILLGTHGKKTPPRFIRGLYRGFAIPGHLAGQIVRKGMPLLVNEMFWSLGMTMLTQCYSYRGLDAIAALNINSTVLNLFNTVIFTMGNTVGIIIGNLLGAEEYDRARNYCPKLAALSCAASAAVGVVMFLVAPYAPRLYNTSHEIMTLAASLMRICALMLPVHAVVNAAYWTIRAGGRTYITMLSDSVFTWVVSVSIAWVLIHKTGLPLVEAYLFVNLADLIKMVIGIVLLRRGIWVRNIVTGEEIAAGNAAG